MKKKSRTTGLVLLVTMTITMTSMAATPQEVQEIIDKNPSSYTAGTNSVYGPYSNQEQLNAVAEAVADFKANYIMDSMDNDKKISIAHEYLKDNVSYIDWELGEGANAAYGALVKGKAACSGYAMAFKALCDAMDVSCYYIHADVTAAENSDGGGVKKEANNIIYFVQASQDHQWNMVEYNDGYYFIDVQANDNDIGLDFVYHSEVPSGSCDMSLLPAVGSKSGRNTSGNSDSTQIVTGAKHNSGYDIARPLVGVIDTWNLKLPSQNLITNNNIQAMLTNQMDKYYAAPIGESVNPNTGQKEYVSETDYNNSRSYENNLYHWYCNWLNDISFENMTQMQRAQQVKKVLQGYYKGSDYKQGFQGDYAVLINNEGSCPEFARTAKSLCTALGLKCEIVDYGEHSTYYVWIDGERYMGEGSNLYLYYNAQDLMKYMEELNSENNMIPK